MKSVIFVIIFFLANFTFAQNDSIQYNQNAYISALGGSGIFAANYEYQFLIKEKSFFDMRAGVGFHYDVFKDFINELLDENEKTTAVSIPHHVAWNRQIFSKNNFIEIGFGATYFKNEVYSHYLIYPVLNYRYFPKNKRFNFKIGVEIPLNSKNNSYNPFGIFPVSCGFGYRF